MKILSVSQLREADRFTIEEEGVPSLELMERAATQCFEWVTKRFRGNAPFVIFCGRGNNGGDGLALARLLRGSGRKVRVLILEHTDHSSDDWKHNLER
ncbi:MAG: bifunctional ADP-dependent NAD(P)H-hydrate dehydratase/NAD(P)H-hydrate epimerase, partial [Bacteroidota bacterium]|nr:bifunctional ADP-dependent NAD(P)H-hydrate dehydratase/NAD(P)H-hydrate epimerase [Bacteroidota bacterium]